MENKDNQVYKIKYLRDVDKNVSISKYIVIGCLSLTFLTVIGSMYLYKEAIIKQKPNPLVMDKNGEIKQTRDIYNDGYEVLSKKAAVKKSHELFFRLEPDELLIKANIKESKYYADFQPLFEYYNSQNYYSSIVQRNAIQYIKTDSIVFQGEEGRFYGKLYIKGQGGAYKESSLITQFNVEKREPTDHNLHGFYLDKIKIVENKEIINSTSEENVNNELLETKK